MSRPATPGFPIHAVCATWRSDRRAAHDLRGVGEEGAAIVAAQVAAIDEAHVRLMHQRRGVQHGIAPAIAQPGTRQVAQFTRSRRVQGVLRTGYIGVDAPYQFADVQVHRLPSQGLLDYWCIVEAPRPAVTGLLGGHAFIAAACA
jgi:hypothetical protein